MPLTTEGGIMHCADQGCGHICCDFAAGNYIVLYPGELVEARRHGHSIDHLLTTPDGQGGHRAICRARDTATCDRGYKPLDCASYPFFPTIDEHGALQTGLKGEKCPLQARHLATHQKWVVRRWTEVAVRITGLKDWIRQSRLVGYIRVSGD